MKGKDTIIGMAANPAINTESAGGSRPTRIATELIDGRARIRTLDQGYFLGGRPLQCNGSHVRMALVGIHLALLAGDAVDIRIQVGAGTILEVMEPAGMVAYDADGRRSAWHLAATIGRGATLIWKGAEFVAARGSNVRRGTELEMAHDARALFKETLVLGRSGESDIRLNSRTKVFQAGRELLVEELAVTPENRMLPGIAGASKVIGTVMALGMRPGDEGADARRLDLAGPGALWRALAPAAHSAELATGPVFERWRRQALQRPDSDPAAALTDGASSSDEPQAANNPRVS